MRTLRLSLAGTAILILLGSVGVCKAGNIYLTSDTDSVVWRLAGATASVE
jgi:hypothetical protein